MPWICNNKFKREVFKRPAARPGSLLSESARASVYIISHLFFIQRFSVCHLSPSKLIVTGPAAPGRGSRTRPAGGLGTGPSRDGRPFGPAAAAAGTSRWLNSTKVNRLGTLV